MSDLRHWTVDDVRAALDNIRAEAGDDEVAHARQDELWRNTLEAISLGAADPWMLAAEALTAQDIEFRRRFA